MAKSRYETNNYFIRVNAGRRPERGEKKYWISLLDVAERF